MCQIIDGKKISQEIKDELKERMEELSACGETRCLAVIKVGNDPASAVYVRNKERACKYIGIKPDLYDPIEEDVKAYLRGE